MENGDGKWMYWIRNETRGLPRDRGSDERAFWNVHEPDAVSIIWHIL